MKQIIYGTFLMLFLCEGTSFAEQTSLGKYTLAPGEKKTVSIDTKEELKVGFTNELPMQEAMNCKKMCIRMSVVGNKFLDATAAIGTSMQAAPIEGKIQLVFENLEEFPIPIDVYRK